MKIEVLNSAGIFSLFKDLDMKVTSSILCEHVHFKQDIKLYIYGRTSCMWVVDIMGKTCWFFFVCMCAIYVMERKLFKCLNKKGRVIFYTSLWGVIRKVLFLCVLYEGRMNT